MESRKGQGRGSHAGSGQTYASRSHRAKQQHHTTRTAARDTAPKKLVQRQQPAANTQTQLHEQQQQQQQTPKRLLTEQARPKTTVSSEEAGVQTLVSDAQFSDSAKRILASHTTSFRVIGVLGRQGVGKSSVLSLLHQPSTTPQDATLFETSSDETTAAALHTTDCIHIATTPDRLLLIDTPPILSPSILASVRDARQPDLQLLYHDLQLILFLTRVCHTILVVLDHTPDAALLRLLRVADALLPHKIGQHSAIPSAIAQQLRQHSPTYSQFVFVYNKAPREFFVHGVTQRLEQSLRAMFHSTSHISSGQMGGSGAFDHHTDAEHQETTTDQQRSAQCMMLLPVGTKHAREAFLGHPDLSVCSQQLREQVLSLPRRKLGDKITTEQSWLHAAHQVWQQVQASPEIERYVHRVETSGGVI
eukprot:m.16660 g.16660  ORF g.16660 m.16660 type:complete len:419 (-) comp7161_c0_seq1:59-1315(-)